MELDLEGKTALLTGAAAGIGRATAINLAAAGASVVLSDIDESGGERALAAVEASGSAAPFVRADVSRAEDVELAVLSARERFGGLDIAFNSAGVEGPVRSIIDTTVVWMASDASSFVAGDELVVDGGMVAQ